MINFNVDYSNCIECGLCAQECPVGIIGMDSKPFIAKEKETNCLQCQHCLAVCPTEAISILGKDPKDSISVRGELPSPDAMERLIKTRRSIRRYKKENIDPQLIQELLETASYAPTGHNDNAVLFSVIDNREDLDLFRKAVYASIKIQGETGNLAPKFQFLQAIQKMWDLKGVDVLFRDAPHLLIASAPKADASPLADCLISLAYFELLANSRGLGTLWNGMVKWSIEDVDPQLQRLIGIPEDHSIGYVMVFGKPAVNYARSIQSEGLKLNRIKLG